VRNGQSDSTARCCCYARTRLSQELVNACSQARFGRALDAVLLAEASSLGLSHGRCMAGVPGLGRRSVDLRAGLLAPCRCLLAQAHVRVLQRNLAGGGPHQRV
jgi:hypothetical protein